MTSRFKRLDLIACLKSYEWWFLTLTGAGDQNHPQEKNAKRLSEEALQIAEKRRKGKGKGERERYAHLNAEFQRIARRDKKGFLSDRKK